MDEKMVLDAAEQLNKYKKNPNPPFRPWLEGGQAIPDGRKFDATHEIEYFYADGTSDNYEIMVVPELTPSMSEQLGHMPNWYPAWTKLQWDRGGANDFGADQVDMSVSFMGREPVVRIRTRNLKNIARPDFAG